MPVNNAGAQALTNHILEDIRQRVAEAMPELAEKLQATVQARCPTPEEEYRAIMVGDGGGEYDPPPLAGNQSADDPSTGRVRFRKEPNTFLAELAVRPENILVTEDSVSVGNYAFLVENARFSFKDFIPKKPRKGASYPMDFFTSASYFEAFEYGTADGASWTGDVSAEGTWRLRPDDTDSHPPGPRSMSKPIEQRLMYAPGELEEIAKAFLDGILASR